MSSVRIASAQINSTVGDIHGNIERILEYCHRAAAESADVVVFPEMVVTGYPVEDLALRHSFQRTAIEAVERLATLLARDGLGHLTVIVGSLGRTPAGRPQNVAAVLRAGMVEAEYAKHHLPNYGVFDERRHFQSGAEPCLITVAGVTLSLAICEDIWQPDSPAEIAAIQHADCIVVLNASPFETGKHHLRVDLCSQLARRTDTIVVYNAAVGGQDELVFDGGSMMFGAEGDLVAASPRFIEHLLFADIHTDNSRGDTVRDGSPAEPVTTDSRNLICFAPELGDTGAVTEPLNLILSATQRYDDSTEVDGFSAHTLAEVYAALIVGLDDYVNKNGMRSVVLGLSGGIDSALVAAIACDALGAAHVYGIAMPSKYSSSHSVEDAHDTAERTGLSIRQVPIAPVFDAYQGLLDLSGLAEENLQARIRGTTLMAVSNAEGHLVLATGNKSELAVGYSTIYGDAVGGFAPIKDVPKTMVWALSRWRNNLAVELGQTPPIPPRSISKEPSAELRPDQLDSDSLPDYRKLDSIVAHYVEGGVSAEELVAAGFSQELARRVIRMTDTAEYKRRQYPPGTKITRLAFGRDRRMPITNRWSEPDASGE